MAIERNGRALHDGMREIAVTVDRVEDLIPYIEETAGDLLAWARLYLELGLKPLPRRCGSKHPGVRWKPYQDRSPTSDEIADWFRDPDTTGICTVLDNTPFVVLELDAATSEQLPDARALLTNARIAVPHACPHVVSGSGRSEQFWFRSTTVRRRYIAALTHADGAKAGGVQLDILASGIVVLPPTPHLSTGRSYRWLPPFLTRASVPELP